MYCFFYPLCVFNLDNISGNITQEIEIEEFEIKKN